MTLASNEENEIEMCRGIERYSIKWVLGQNLFIMIYFAIGFIGLYPLQIKGYPVLALIYALFIIIMLAIVLKKHPCSNCYYYGKRCNTGWGILSAYMFKRNSGNYELGIKLAAIVWSFATVVPILGMIALLIVDYSILNLALFILFLILTRINIWIHRKACMKCKMKYICPAYLGNKICLIKPKYK